MNNWNSNCLSNWSSPKYWNYCTSSNLHHHSADTFNGIHGKRFFLRIYVPWDSNPQTRRCTCTVEPECYRKSYRDSDTRSNHDPAYLCKSTFLFWSIRLLPTSLRAPVWLWLRSVVCVWVCREVGGVQKPQWRFGLVNFCHTSHEKVRFSHVWFAKITHMQTCTHTHTIV